jgi:hypothetical protein
VAYEVEGASKSEPRDRTDDRSQTPGPDPELRGRSRSAKDAEEAPLSIDWREESPAQSSVPSSLYEAEEGQPRYLVRRVGDDHPTYHRG